VSGIRAARASSLNQLPNDDPEHEQTAKQQQ
jgi:hypothetical protein